MIGYIKLKTNNQELYETNYLQKLKEKDRQKDILIQSLIERIEKLEKEVKDGKDKF